MTLGQLLRESLGLEALSPKNKFVGLGDDIRSGGAGRDKMFGGLGDDVLMGEAGRDKLFGGTGHDRLFGGEGNDKLFGGTGDDYLSGGAGRDKLHGGTGIDTVSYAGGIADYEVSARGKSGAAAGKFSVTNLAGDTDKLVGIERIEFRADGYVADLTGGNNVVLARDDTAEAQAGAVLRIEGLTDNDLDFDRDALQITAIDTAALRGSATLNADGSIDYDAGDAFAHLGMGETGQTVLHYTVSDGRGSTDTAQLVITVTGTGAPAEAPAVFLNEIHYDNVGSDTGEFVEIAGVAGTDLTGWSVVFYNGNGGGVYDTITLDAALSGDSGEGYLVVDKPGLQNGAPDGIALVDAEGKVVEFLSYEGSLTATDGPAAGMTATDIGVSEGSGTAVGHSLQRRADGSWAAPAAETRGASNVAAAPLQISEIAISTTGTDWEFLELSGRAGTSLDGLSLVQIGGTGEVLSQIDLDGSSIGATGHFLATSAQAQTIFGVEGDLGFANNTFQNDSSSFLLVSGAGTLAGDLDADDDGVLDTPLNVVDGLALVGPDMPLTYATPVLGPDGSYLPAGAQRQEDGSFAITSFSDSDGYTPTPGTEVVAPPPPSGTSRISEVQGGGESSPLLGATVSVEAVVTATVSNGFYLQEEDADADGDAGTSEGVFVYTGGSPDVTIGDLARVTGTVGEYRGATQISLDSFEVLAQFEDLPSAVELSLPFSTDLEAYEGMQLVVIAEPDDAPLTVIETYQLARYGEIVISEGLQFQPTQLFDPQTQAEEVAALQAANAANRLILDDGNGSQNPTEFAYVPNTSPGDDGDGILGAADDFGQGGTLRIGAELTAPVRGVLTEFSGDYKLVPTQMLEIDPATNEGTREATPAEVGGDLQVVSFNALNYFTTLGERGASSPEDLARQTDKLVNALVELDGDIVGLQEIENNGFGEGSAIAALVDALNARLGAEEYAFVDPTADGGLIGGDAITTGLIYRTDAVGVVGADFLVFDDGAEQRNRPTVAAAFEDADGERITVAVNHFKSKGGTGETPGDRDSGDGQGNFNETRTEAAQQLTAWLATDPLGAGDPDVLLIGDLNAYGQEDPVQAIEAAGYANLVEELIGADAFSYVFDGQLGTLDHALASEGAAAQVTGITEWHINSLEPGLLRYSSEFTDPGFYSGSDPYGASDHDPILIGLDLNSDPLVA